MTEAFMEDYLTPPEPRKEEDAVEILAEKIRSNLFVVAAREGGVD